MEQFVSYTNAGIQPQYQGNDFGVDMGYRKPVFDVKVSAQKKNVYTKVSQNELALQFFDKGFFNPQLVDQALMTLEMMDFDGKEEIMQKVARNGNMFQKLVQYMQLSLGLAQIARPDMVPGLSQDIMATVGGAVGIAGGAGGSLFQGDHLSGGGMKENAIVENAREQSNNSSQPDSGKVIRGKEK